MSKPYLRASNGMIEDSRPAFPGLELMRLRAVECIASALLGEPDSEAPARPRRRYDVALIRATELVDAALDAAALEDVTTLDATAVRGWRMLPATDAAHLRNFRKATETLRELCSSFHCLPMFLRLMPRAHPDWLTLQGSESDDSDYHA